MHSLKIGKIHTLKLKIFRFSQFHKFFRGVRLGVCVVMTDTDSGFQIFGEQRGRGGMLIFLLNNSCLKINVYFVGNDDSEAAEGNGGGMTSLCNGKLIHLISNMTELLWMHIEISFL